MTTTSEPVRRGRVGRARRLASSSRVAAEGSVWEGRGVVGASHSTTGAPLVVACGALAAELRATLGDLVEVEYLPANLHSRPDRIVPSIEPRLAAAVAAGRPVFVAYADCGTGGRLDALLSEYPGVERLPGAHCYETFAGAAGFAELSEQELGTLYLTDFLAKHFDALVWAGFGLDRHPELLPMYFGGYQRVVLLSQRPTDAVIAAAQAAADRLGLEFHHHATGLDRLAAAIPVTLRRANDSTASGTTDDDPTAYDQTAVAEARSR